MRGLSPTFLSALQTGLLHPLLERVQLDRTLCLDLRDDYINVYYRGGNLLRLKRNGDAYLASFDLNYATGTALHVPNPNITAPEHLAIWLHAMPQIKLAMDLYLGHHPKEEREIQQLIARDNNMGSVSRSTDYYMCDIEYAHGDKRFDIVGVHWPSTPSDRKQSNGRRLVLGEVKQGDASLTGKAGLHGHVVGVDTFLSDPARVARIKEEMVTVFNQKRSLNLMDSEKDLESFTDERPLFLLILANHDPAKTKLRDELSSLPQTLHCDVRIVTSSLVGYGLYDPGMLTVEQALAMPTTSL